MVARMTAKLKMNPVNAMNLDSSEGSGHISRLHSFPDYQILSVE
jgi:hypothetical protein